MENFEGVNFIFQEIEAFLKELEEEIDQIGEFEEEIYDEEVNGEEVTTDEFDRFLKRRVEAATKKETEVRLKLTLMHYKMAK